MATKGRRGGSFGAGSLLGVPQALPDDDNDQQQAEEQPAVPESTVATVSVVAPPEAEPAPSSARKGPPTTYRLNDPASTAVWEAFTKAKTADPFLSLRQFTSDVVLQGLASRERREKRR